ncbi:pyruvate phosphate dikinase [Petrotoga sp. HWH.PT.55.6.1]|uniref:pyruvate, phosphate dikinase n=1 Tax=unclassified Petrotoga TaxID=2620614 RepID=UPI000CA02EF1|nr:MULTISPECIES: pyruvate, phosphate dikinase [unclassified Petrotoga]PNR89507.1 pyruvate phosphate dikinase [Petrotoga sp. 9T1HF07.CasAA.8.2]PNR90752.1 pyruvate phosphate dikinase [Petrotoga sp. HWHPT.55.6.3]RPD35988.1 pyruvate phosphate dikinase [Petrotoga sp. HWH.PT.55.6.1]
MGKKYVYVWNKNRVEGNSKMKDILGGKGANLAEMASLGLPVPPGFTISTEVCKYYWDNGRKFPEDLKSVVEEAMRELENVTGKKFGDNANPLLVSVRSGAAVSMPGMMDTILNLGLNDESVEGLAKLTNNERFAWDSYRRFIQMFGDVALGIAHEKFEEALNEVKKEKGVKQDLELDANDLKKVVELYKKLYKEEGKEFPQDPMKQLWIAIEAVFGSWNNPRAIKYRQINEMDKQGLLGTAVNVVAMVFGNMGEDSGTGVAFTRNPNTGEKKYYGEFLTNAQGEDVVAGIRTPKSLDELKSINPKTYNQLLEVMDKLEKHFRDMQDIEFTVEKGQLYMLQTRSGKRTAAAAVKIAVDMVKEGLISKQEAVMRVKPADIEKLLHPIFDSEELKNAQYIGKGLPASPGAATGKIVFSADDAEKLAKDGEKVILARPETSPEDVGGMNVAEGILTSRGGMTSHAAVVARGMGKTAVVGAEDIVIDLKNKVIKSNGVELKEGDWISIDGNEGKVYAGKIKTVRPEGLAGDISVLLEYADEVSVLGVRANADIPRDAKVAREFGAQGIGLCRTEHMFFGPERINKMRTMIVSKTEEQRKAALEQLLPFQRSDFKGLFEEMEGFSVTIRLLDPPLHEFVPENDEQIKEVAKMIGISEEELRSTVKDLEEFNPMMGHRGVRLAITYPEIAEMQTKAIILAAIDMIKEGKKVQPEIMIPLVGNVKELTILKESVKRIADELIKENNVDLEYKIGTMIEVPRACVVADQIGAEADFFSFGTNDLTQLGLGFSRDDYGKFIGDYIEKGIYEKDPFQQIDREGVGRLIKLALDGGRSTNPKLKVGICGEHGGDPDSIEFAHLVGLDYVSCSPYRVPVARLAAAQAAVNYKRGKTVNY